MPVSSPSKPTRPDGRRTERRAEILAHALRLFREQGVHGVSTRQIAAAVGISQPSLYAHFPTKQDLVAAACVGAFDALATAMLAALDVGGEPPQLERLARVYVDFGLSHPDAYRVAFMLEEAGPHRADAALAAGIACFRVHRDAIARVMGPERSESDIEAFAQSSWASLHGLVSLLLARPEFPWIDRERLIALHIRRAMAAP